MKKMILNLLLLIPATLCLANSIGQEEMNDLYSQGKEFFRQANQIAIKNPKEAHELYQKAAIRFERIVQEGGVKNGKLYYNLGNVYFRMQDIGKAILNYRRAQMFIADDPNLQQNLEYARSKRIDRLEEKQKTRILSTVFFWHYDFSPKTRLILFLIFFDLLWICASIRLFIPKAWITLVIIISGIIAMAFFTSLALDIFIDPYSNAGVILSPEVTARKGDGETYEPSFKEPLHAGTEFLLLEKRREWYHIELVDGQDCWILSSNAGIIK